MASISSISDLFFPIAQMNDYFSVHVRKIIPPENVLSSDFHIFLQFVQH